MHQPVLSVNQRSILKCVCTKEHSLIFGTHHCQALQAKVSMQACVLIPEPSFDDEVQLFHMTCGMKAHMSAAASLR